MGEDKSWNQRSLEEAYQRKMDFEHGQRTGVVFNDESARGAATRKSEINRHQTVPVWHLPPGRGGLMKSASGHKEVAMGEQSSKARDFAEVMTQATALFGSKEDGARWLSEPALALEGQRPIDLLSTSAGHDLVKDLLTRLEFGVYA